jgi:hypothetical protein
LLTDDYFERGLPARFLWNMSQRNEPRQFSKTIVSPELFAEVRELLSKLRELKPHIDEQSGLHTPVLLSLNSEAEKIFTDFYNEVGRVIHRSSPRVAAQWSKLIGYSARLALVGQLAHDPDAKEISGEIMEHACALARRFGNEAERIFSMLAETQEQREDRELCEFAERRGGSVTVREVSHDYWPLKGKRNEAEERLNRLVRRGFGKWEPIPTTPKGGKPTRKFVLLIHPHPRNLATYEGKPEGYGDGDVANSQKNEAGREPDIEAAPVAEAVDL